MNNERFVFGSRLKLVYASRWYEREKAFKDERGAQFEKLAGIIRIIKAEGNREKDSCGMILEGA